MKTKRLTAVALMFAAATAFCQTPAQTVRDAVKSRYPDATIKKVKQEGNEYKAVFKRDNKRETALFTSSVQWLKTTVPVKTADLPADVKAGYKNSNYNGWYVQNCNRVQTRKGVEYSLDVTAPYTFNGSFKTDTFIYFTPQGNLVSK